MTSKTIWVPIALIGIAAAGILAVLGAIVVLYDQPFGGAFGPPPASPTVPQVETANPNAGTISGVVWHDLCAAGREGEPAPASPPAGCVLVQNPTVYAANGVREPEEPGLDGVIVRLGLGPCPSIGFMTTTADASGAYRFDSLAAGTYCVSIDSLDPANAGLLDGGWTHPARQGNSAILVGVTIPEAGSQADVNFGWNDQFLPAPIGAATPSPTASACINQAAFVQDVTIPDNTIVAPGRPFEKVWRLRNTGDCTWTTDYALIFTSGHRMGATSPLRLPVAVEPGRVVDVKVSLTAPAGYGTYRGHWHLQDGQGRLFGIGERGDKPFWVQIVVGTQNARVNGSWRGEYFVNPQLKGKPTYVRYDPLLDFDWGFNAPAAGLPNDKFSVRWTATALFDAATYRFSLLVDDGVRLWVDDELIINSWKDGSVRELTTELGLAKGTHDLRLEYYENTQSARVRLRWSKVSDPSFPDWKAEYFSNRTLRGEPVLVRNDENIDFQWKKGSPAVGVPENDFSVRWTDRREFNTGVYRFHAYADDGIRVFIDGKLKLDRWFDSDGTARHSFDTALSGRHRVIVEYYEHAGGAKVELWWERVNATATPSPTATQPPPTTVTPTPSPSPTETQAPTSETETPTPTPTETVLPTEPPPPTDIPEPEILYSFTANYCSASWRGSAGPLACPSSMDDPQGSILRVDKLNLEDGTCPSKSALILRPEQADFGWVEGAFPAVDIQSGDRFYAVIGCLKDMPACNIGLEFTARLPSGESQNLGVWVESYDGQIREIDLDLSPLAGQAVSFVFTVYGEKASNQNVAFWLQPAIWR
jgi:hypothetical protein